MSQFASQQEDGSYLNACYASTRHDTSDCQIRCEQRDCDCVCHLNQNRLDSAIQDMLKMPRRSS